MTWVLLLSLSESVGSSSSSGLHSTCGSLLIASSLIDDDQLRTPSKCSAHLFKIASLSVRRLVPSALRSGEVPELWGPYTVLSASKNFFMSFLSVKDWISSAFFLSQESFMSLSLVWTVLHVWIGSLARYSAGISEVGLVFLVFLFKESLNFFVVLIKPILVFARYWESIAEEWTVSLKTVQLSSTASELCSSASKQLQRLLTNACLLLSCFSLETSNFYGTFLPCGRRTGWMRRLSLLTTSLWSVQQSAPHIVLVPLTSCLSFLRTMT